ncbi:hypothetical protein POSPLADRAFT_1062662 [Postia placenta MAD-698-R-SB12]|uniref:Uncharacterized protein n=1 Tax=Postia placenta MAD-698-R-SB12 TaxID=670580 RepID=A0A1X6MJI8_9APHY|nr:hypothetical protein POSPLADRAFT_1062662 [Postia placenta MAD-698-R-SB12]OSX56515.1 hypothetical protein POSPLADRAFT_1062662 [Postia placenta MAD-698-R-SB12]
MRGRPPVVIVIAACCLAAYDVALSRGVGVGSANIWYGVSYRATFADDQTYSLSAFRERGYRANASALHSTCASDGREYTHLPVSALSTAHSVPPILTRVVHSNCVPAVTHARGPRPVDPSVVSRTSRADTLKFLTRACACRRRSWPSASPERRSCRALLARRTPRACAPAHPRIHATYVSGLLSLAAPQLTAGATASPCQKPTAFATRYGAAFHTPPPIWSFSLALEADASSRSGHASETVRNLKCARTDSQVVGAGLRDPRGGAFHSG